MKKEEKEELLKDLFKSYPQADKFYMTSDGQPFLVRHFADGHASGLKDKNVETHLREDQELTEEPANTDQNPADKTDGENTGQTPAEDRDSLVVRYIELFGKNPTHNTGVEKLKSAIAAKEAESK